MIRKKGLIFLAVISCLLILSWFFFSDSWFERKIEDIASKANGAKVELSGFHISFLKGKISWNKLEVTNPSKTMENLIQTGPAKFEMAILPIFEKKVIINTIQVESLQTATPRMTDGKLQVHSDAPEEPGFFTRQFKNIYQKSIGSAPVSQIQISSKDLNTDSLLSIAGLQSIKKIDSLKNNLRGISEYWEKTADTLNIRDEISQIQELLKNTNPQKIKKISELKTYLNQLKKARKKLKKLKSQSQELRNKLTSDIQTIQTTPNMAQNWINDDLNRLKNMTPLGKMNRLNIVSFLVGPQLASYYSTWLKYQDRIDGLIKKHSHSKPPKAKPKRFKGQTIHFIRQKAKPNFWIKKISFSGTLKSGFKLSGSVHDVCTQPTLIQKEMTIVFNGKRTDGAQLTGSGRLNYLDSIPQTIFSFAIQKFPIVHYKLPQAPFTPDELSKSDASAKVKINRMGKELNSRISLILSRPEFKFPAPDPSNAFVQNAIIDAFREINPIKIAIQSRFAPNNSMLSIQSNLDKQLKNAISSQFGKQKKIAEQKLKTELEKKLAPYQNNLLALSSQLTQKLNAKQNSITRSIQQNEKALDLKKKEVEKELSKRLKKEGGKLLKNLF